jgi:hypothetical protein
MWKELVPRSIAARRKGNAAREDEPIFNGLFSLMSNMPCKNIRFCLVHKAW